MTALDDGTKTIRVVASHGRTGEQTELAYTSCKVIGNGSFGVVYSARHIGGGPNGQDGEVAIKKVLQDKRFKVFCGPIG